MKFTLATLWLLFALLMISMVSALPAPPEEEEEETPKPPVRKVVPVESKPSTPPTTPTPPTPIVPLPRGGSATEERTMPEGDTRPDRPPIGLPTEPETTISPPTTEPSQVSGAYLVPMRDLIREATLATQPELKAYLNLFSVAYDRVALGKQKPLRVTPLPLRWGKDKFPEEFGIVPFSEQDELLEIRTLNVKQVNSITPFEMLVIDETDRLIRSLTSVTAQARKKPIPAAEVYATAEKVLTAAYFFHNSAREQNRRRGKNWDDLKDAIYVKLSEVRLGRLTIAGQTRDWAKLNELSLRYSELYRERPPLLEDVLVERLAEAEFLAKSDRPIDLIRARELLAEYETRFPQGTAERANTVRNTLKEKSAKLLRDAERIFTSNRSEARNLLQSVEKIDPDNANLRSLQQEMKFDYPVLLVGTPRMPEFCSPALARAESELQILDLVYEGLLEAIPDEVVGSRFRPALALDRGEIFPGYRDYHLEGLASWHGSSARQVTAADVAGTLRLMRQRPYLRSSEAALWWDDPAFDPADVNRLRIRLKHGHPDPRALLTMKIMPANLLLETNRQLDDASFARAPIGTGPFQFQTKPVQPGETTRETILQAAPAYSRRNGKLAQPQLREIRFVNTTLSSDLVADFRAERLHLLCDVPTSDLKKYTVDNNLAGKVRVVTVKEPGRLQILAINHRKPYLQNVELRQGLCLAIDRERVLNDVYRPREQGGSPGDFHKACTGPFPPGSWAEPKPLGGQPPALYNRDLAAIRMRNYLNTPGAIPQLSLLFPNDDPLAQAACERMKMMIESPTSDDSKRLKVVLEAVSFRELVKRTEEEGRFDLAYLPFDYPDVWFPHHLANQLDAKAHGRYGRNLGYWNATNSTPNPADITLATSLEQIRNYREYEASLLPRAHAIHAQFNLAVPFVPLWQLDRHLVIATKVKLFLDGRTEELPANLLNPTSLFKNISRWRVE